MKFNQEDLASALSKAKPALLNNADFGIIELSSSGEVLFFNQHELNSTGLTQREVKDKNLFTQLVPSTDNYMVSHKYRAVANTSLPIDETIDYVLTYQLKPTSVKLRLLKQDNRQWLCVKALH